MVKLDIAQVLWIIRKELGYGSWVTSAFIKEVAINETIDTLAITNDGTIHYNPTFWKKNVNTPNKMAEAIIHELFHKVFGDFTRSLDEVANIAGDIVINYTIHNMLGHADLFESYYPKSMWQGMLRPGSEGTAKRSKFKYIHDEVWGNVAIDRGKEPSITQLYSALCVLMDVKKIGVYTLIGSHGAGARGKKDKASRPTDGELDSRQLDVDTEQRGKIAEDLIEAIGGKNAGYGNELMQWVIKALKQKCSLKQSLLKDFCVSNKVNKLMSYYRVRKPTRSVFPQHPTRRELAMMACGYYPVFWTNELYKMAQENRGIVFYVDVSGSMYSDLPDVIGVIANFRSNVKKVFQFSNEIAEVSLTDMIKGKIHSTGGTDFNCIIKHAVDHRFDKIVIFTDGYADASGEFKNQALTHIRKACVVLTGSCTNENNFFSKQYHRTFKLDEIVTGRKR